MDNLKNFGQLAEQESHNPIGRIFDGAPYTCYGKHVNEFLAAAISYYGSYEALQHMVVRRKEAGELQADENCGNWILWTVLLAVGANCEQS